VKAKNVVALTMRQAQRMGIVYCAHCGWRRNNHYRWGKKKCAFKERDGFKPCKGWKPKFMVGQVLR
jgi:hypothetical protein